MSTGSCVRCGRSGEMEYGTDGMSYCSSCIFYGLNKQCVRCRMYLPAAELQQYRGQWTCPYCIQDMRDEDRRATEYHPEKPRLEAIQLPEQCERCGRDLEGMVYIWNGKKLCRRCVDDEQAKWGLVGGGPMGSPTRITLEKEGRRRKTSLIEGLIGDVLQILGIRRKPRKVEILEYKAKMPIALAKPMAEKPMRRKDEKLASEGPMGVGEGKMEDFFENEEKPPAKAKGKVAQLMEELGKPENSILAAKPKRKRVKKTAESKNKK